MKLLNPSNVFIVENDKIVFESKAECKIHHKLSSEPVFFEEKSIKIKINYEYQNKLAACILIHHYNNDNIYINTDTFKLKNNETELDIFKQTNIYYIVINIYFNKNTINKVFFSDFSINNKLIEPEIFKSYSECKIYSDQNCINIEGYLSKSSFDKNETVNVMVNTIDESFSINIYTYKDFLLNNNPIISDSNIQGKIQNTNIKSFAYGCDWEPSYNFKISDSWKKGIYIIKIKTTNTLYNNIFYLFFILKNNTIIQQKNVVLINTNTHNAYNTWNGYYSYFNKTKYGYLNNDNEYILDIKTCYYNYSSKTKKLPSETKYSTGPKGVSKIVSFKRPNRRISEEIKNKYYIFNEYKIVNKYRYSHLFIGESYLLDWLDNNNIDYDLIDDMDLHLNTVNLNQYNNIILNCHPEYWSNEMFKTFTEFSINNNIIALSGNNIYRKVFIKDNMMIKDLENNKTDDEMLNMSKKYVNSKNIKNWIIGYNTWVRKKHMDEIIEPHELLGSLYENLCYDFAPYKITNINHWIFEGIDLKNNDFIGKKNLNNKLSVDSFGAGSSGHETDQCIYDDKFILAKGINKEDKGGHIYLYERDNGSKVFSVGSVVFTGSLSVDNNISIMILNVFNKLNSKRVII
tara:strand:- start:5184 stop:7073 length:1890 start_codon:yes stop_codon:yes gene_type:complete